MISRSVEALEEGNKPHICHRRAESSKNKNKREEKYLSVLDKRSEGDHNWVVGLEEAERSQTLKISNLNYPWMKVS